MKPIILPIIFISLLSACATPEELARMRAQEQAEQQARYQSQLNATRNKCWDYGHKEGSESFASCVQTEMSAAQRDAQRQAERAQRESERREYERREREQQGRDHRAREQRQHERGPEGCTMYEHANYGGAKFHLEPGGQRESVDPFNDRASSVRVGAQCAFTVYEHLKFRGKNRTFYSDAGNLGSDWNDQVSSVKCSCR